MLPRKKLSTLILLSSSFVLLIAITSGLIGYISLQNGRHAVEDIAQQLQTQIFMNIQQKLSDYLAMPHRLNRLNQNFILKNPAMLEDIEQLHPIYLEQLKAFDLVWAVAMGVEKQGNFVGVGHKDDAYSFSLMDRKKDNTYRVYFVDTDGKVIKLLTESPDYDARTRAWYKAAVEAQQAGWSPIYIWAGDTGIGITAVLPTYAPTGELIGVQQAAMSLDFIAHFLEGVQVGKSGQVFLIEQDGLMVASSLNDPVIQKGAKAMERVKAVDSANPFIRAAASHLFKEWGALNHLPPMWNSRVEIDGQLYLLSAAPLKDSYGLNWVVVTGLPESDIMAQIDINTRFTIGLCVVASVIAMGLGVVIARKFAATHQRLEKEIAERKHAEEAAKVANQAKSTFLANMSHELRTPLNGVLGYAQILRQSSGLSQEQRSGLDVIYQSGSHLLMLINDVLDLAKIEAGKMTLYPVELNLLEFLRGVSQIVQMRAYQKQIPLEVEFDPDLPLAVLADETRLRQVLLNLLSNAVKFTDKGTVIFKVHHVSSPPTPQTWLCFEVIDSGVGIAPDQLEKIFSAFEQVGDHTRQQEGTGLGLAVAQQIVDLMGGQLRVESSVGQGSRFWFEIPLLVLKEVPPSPSPSQQVTGYLGARRHVLVVDDRMENRLVLLNLLQPLGFQVSLAENGREGLEKAYALRPDLILMDLVMPVMTGFEAVQELRQHPFGKTLPIIAISASVLEINRAESRLRGFDDFLPKPIQLTALLDIISHYLGLTWEHHPQPYTLTPLPNPTSKQLETLYELAMFGDMEQVVAWADKLEAQNPHLATFAEQVRHHAAHYEDEPILALIKQVLTPHEGGE